MASMAEERKLVSVLFADVVGSTAMASTTDAEVVRSVMAAYFAIAREAVEEHGGRVEKFIGDAVMAVFGVPRAHGDDAERAVRAALAVQAAVPALNADLGMELAVRIGVNTGEVVASTGEGDQFLVTGDPVNVAARLQQAAAPGQVLVGALTERLTRTSIDYEAHDPVDAKGKDEPIHTSVAVRARSAVHSGVLGINEVQSPMVGREAELLLLSEAVRATAAERRTSVITVVGSAGIGKSRLVREAMARSHLGDPPHVLYGRCLPFGRSVAYWALAEIVRQDAAIEVADDGSTARRKLDTRLGSLHSDEPARRLVAARLLVLLGLEAPESALPQITPDLVTGELALGMRRHLEAIARERPTVVVIDDLQWGGPDVIATVTQIAEPVRRSALLMVCVGRPELLEPDGLWNGALTRQKLVQLESLSEADTQALIGDLLDVEDMPESLRATVVKRSEGNPLFCEEFARMMIDDGIVVPSGGRWRATPKAAEVRVPDSILALLAARLDSLPPPEKHALQQASVIGESFQAAQLAALDENSARVPDGLEGLLKKGLVIPDQARPERGALRFKHLLIRDVAYGSLAKAERARLHELAGLDLSAKLADRTAEYRDVLLHHAAASLHLSREVKIRDEALQRRASRAVGLALVVGEASLAREDAAGLGAAAEAAREAVASLTEVPPATAAHAVLLEAENLYRAGRKDEAQESGRRAIVLGQAAGQPGLTARAHICLANVGHAAGDYAAFREGAVQAEALFRQAGDRAGEIAARYQAVVFLFAVEARTTEFLEQGMVLRDRALDAGQQLIAGRLLAWMAFAAAFGGRPLELAESYAAESKTLFKQAAAVSDVMLAIAEASIGWLAHDFERGRRALEQSVEAADDTGRATDALWARTMLAQTFVYAGAFDMAEPVLGRAIADSEESGEVHVRNWLYACKVSCALAAGDTGMAVEFATKAMESGAEAADQVAFANLAWARALAADGRSEQAEVAFERATEMLAGIDLAALRTDTALAFGRFLLDQGRKPEARSILEEARGYGCWREEVEAMLVEASGPSRGETRSKETPATPSRDGEPGSSR